MKKKIGYLGAGTWGTALACQLAKNGHEVVVWDVNKELLDLLSTKREHPKLEGTRIPTSIRYVSTMEEAVQDADMVVESVTAVGIREVLKEFLRLRSHALCPFVITSKGIEQNTGLLLPEIAVEILGEKNRGYIGCISGPSHAEEVIRNLPTSVVCSAFDCAVMDQIQKTFVSENFRIYPNDDILGVSFGGAMKNIIAIACGISDGLQFGDNAKAALMTRGLHEIRKLCVAKKCREETLNGLSGLGDLFVTCSSTLSRNYRFGRLIAEGYTPLEAKRKIGMVVEGAYSVVSAYELGQRYQIPLPITNATYAVLYKEVKPKDVVKILLQRAIKLEHL